MTGVSKNSKSALPIWWKLSEERVKEHTVWGGKHDMNFQARSFVRNSTVNKQIVNIKIKLIRWLWCILKLQKCITYIMEVERRASEGAYSMGGKRDMNFQVRIFQKGPKFNSNLVYCSWLYAIRCKEVPSLIQFKIPYLYYLYDGSWAKSKWRSIP